MHTKSPILRGAEGSLGGDQKATHRDGEDKE